MEPSLELRHLRLVEQVSAHGTVTGAAKALGLTQPTLSHQLREVETRLRTPLFVRTGRRMVPTGAGEQLAQVARAVLAEIGNFERQLSSGVFEETRGVLRVATECYTAYHWLPTVLKHFKERWPGVELRVSPEYTSTPIAALRDGALDLAIVSTEPTDRRLRSERLFDDELVVVVSPRHRFARQPFVSAEDFATEHVILYSTDDRPSTLLRDILAPAGVAPERVTRIQLTEAILELVMADMGISVLARWAVAPFIRNGSLSAIRLTERGHFRQWFASMRAGDPTTPFQLDLIQLLRRHLNAGPMLVEGQRIA